jgi:hypothetical protein
MGSQLCSKWPKTATSSASQWAYKDKHRDQLHLSPSPLWHIQFKMPNLPAVPKMVLHWSSLTVLLNLFAFGSMWPMVDNLNTRKSVFAQQHSHKKLLEVFHVWEHPTGLRTAPFSASSHRPVPPITGQFIPTNYRPVYSDQSHTIHQPSGPNKRRPHGPAQFSSVPASLRSSCFLDSVNQIAVNKYCYHWSTVVVHQTTQR